MPLNTLILKVKFLANGKLHVGSVWQLLTQGVTTNEFLYWTIKLISMMEQKVLYV